MMHLLLSLLSTEPWFTSQEAGLVGGLGGAAVGVVCGIFGATCGVLVRRGVGRRAVLGIAWTLVGLAVATLGVGVVALAGGQPYHVWYPFLLLGGVPTVVMGGLIPSLRRNYDASEQRRMDADAMRRS